MSNVMTLKYLLSTVLQRIFSCNDIEKLCYLIYNTLIHKFNLNTSTVIHYKKHASLILGLNSIK